MIGYGDKSTTMKILLVVHVPLDPNAGAASVTLKLGEAYKKSGHDVYYYSCDNLPSNLPRRLTGILFSYYAARHIKKLLREIQLDVIHASSGDIWIWGLLSALLKFPKPLLITQSHGLEHTVHDQILEEVKNGSLKLSWKYPLYNGSVLLWQVKKSFQFSDYCFVLNQYDAKTVQNRMRISAKKVKVFPNGIPDEFIGLPFNPFQPESNSLPGIAFIGAYLNRKGIQYGVPALNNLMRRHPHLRVSFLGTGETADRILSDFNKEFWDRITVVPFFNKTELPQLLRSCHILLFPSLSEGFPLALPEAMACGLAPIVTQIPGPTEIIINGVNGLIVSPRDSLQLEQAAEKLINDIDYLQKLSDSAYRTVQSYTWSNIANRHLELYSGSAGVLEVSNKQPASILPQIKL
jgi:glycosyltransferase involved in cell wall biosynthesis